MRRRQERRRRPFYSSQSATAPVCTDRATNSSNAVGTGPGTLVLPLATAVDRATVRTRVTNLETDGYRVFSYTQLIQVNPPRTSIYLVPVCRVPIAPSGLRVQ